MKKRLMFYCQPVLGIGHYVRSRELVRGLSDFEVCFLNGGAAIPGLELPDWVEVTNLPPIKSDAEFRSLEAEMAGDLIQVQEARVSRLLAELERFKPDLLVIELFPFGRRKFDFELLPLLDAIRSGHPTRVVCSLRDILVRKRNQALFEEEAVALMNRYFDLLLIHSDPEFQPLEETFPKVRDLQCRVVYTGFVARPAATGAVKEPDQFPPVEPGEAAILVSLGGGRVGHELLDCAIRAAQLIGEERSYRMHVLAGPQMPDSEFRAFQERADAEPRLTLERFTPDFPAALRWADLSVSLAGYNTCLDVLSAGVRAIVYPFTGNHNQEQTIRAQKLERLGRVKLIRPGQLDPANLAEAMRLSLSQPAPPSTLPFDTNGVERTAAQLSELARGLN